MFACCQSADAVVENKKTVPEQATAAGTAAKKTQPMIFAIMRNGHEVIRDGVKATKKSIDANDMPAAKKAWEDLFRWCNIHKKMEDGDGSDSTPKGFFRVLDEKCDNVATKEGLFDQHKTLDEKESKLAQELQHGDGGNALKAAFEDFEKENELHLKKEEDVMMPKVMHMKKAGVPLKKVMREEVLALVWDDAANFEFFVTYAVQILAQRDNEQAVRVFAHALWGTATPEEWTTWNKWVKASVPVDVYKEMEPLFSRD